MIHANQFGTTPLLALLLAALAACASHSPRMAAPEAAPPDIHESDDASYDWKGLLIAPFGSRLKAVPLELHETFLFRDEARGASPADDAECYAADAPAPRFLGRIPEEYLLCFRQDRLSRIRASVRLDGADAAGIFDAACMRWSRNGVTAGAYAPASEPQSSGTCEGRDGAVRFSARLEQEAERETSATSATPESEMTLTMVLDGVSDP